MPISILGLSRKHDGTSEHHVLNISSLDDLDLAKPFEAYVNIAKLDDSLYDAHIKADVSLDVECSRCLKHFSKEITFNFHAYYADDPMDDQWAIEKNDLEVEEAIRQEILFSIPTKLLCSKECKGIQK